MCNIINTKVHFLKPYTVYNKYFNKRYSTIKLLEVLIVSKVYNFLKKKKVFMSLCKEYLFTLCSYFYTRLMTFKKHLLYFCYTNISNTVLNVFKYITLTHHINYNKLLLSNRRIHVTHSNIDLLYKSINNTDTFLLLKDKVLQHNVKWKHRNFIRKKHRNFIRKKHRNFIRKKPLKS